jgi:hypothetical protein
MAKIMYVGIMLQYGSEEFRVHKIGEHWSPVIPAVQTVATKRAALLT